jgi:hypothetical protein
LQILENIRCKIQCMMEHTGHFHLCFNGQWRMLPRRSFHAGISYILSACITCASRSVPRVVSCSTSTPSKVTGCWTIFSPDKVTQAHRRSCYGLLKVTVIATARYHEESTYQIRWMDHWCVGDCNDTHDWDRRPLIL